MRTKVCVHMFVTQSTYLISLNLINILSLDTTPNQRASSGLQTEVTKTSNFLPNH